MQSMQNSSYLSAMHDTTRGSPNRQPSKNQSMNSSMKRTQSNNNTQNKSEMFAWDSPNRVAEYLHEVVRTNLDQFAADLPKIISAIFGIPMTPEDVYAAQNEEKKMKPLLLRVSDDISGAGGHKLVKLVCARSVRSESTQSSSSESAREEHGLLAAVRKVRRYHHNAKDFTFPCRYLPSSLFPRSMMGSDQIVTDRATGQSMLRCNAYELLLYAVAAFPVVCRERDIYVPQHNNSDEEFVATFGQAHPGPTDAYLIILESYLDDVLNSQARKQASDDALFMVQVFSAFWLMPTTFDPPRPRPDAFGGGIACLEHSFAALPTRRHIKATVALLRKRSYRPSRGVPAARTLSWAIQLLQPPLYLFLRRAFVHTQTQWSASKNVEAALERGGDLERYVELWKVVTTPRLRPDAWSTYVQGSFLFFTVVLVDLLRLVKVIFRDLHKSITLPTRHRPQYRFLARLLDDFFDAAPATSALYATASTYALAKQPTRRAPKERWQQACRARNQVLLHINYSRHGQQPPPLGDEYGLDLVIKHWNACVGVGSEHLQEVFGDKMENAALEFAVEDGDRKGRVLAKLPGQSLTEATMLDDYVLVEYSRQLYWQPQHEVGEGRASPGKGRERQKVVWQQLYQEVDALQDLFLKGAQSITAVKQARGVWQYVWEEARDRLTLKYENGRLCQQDPLTQLMHVVRQIDLFWDGYPCSGYLAGVMGPERGLQLWDAFPEFPGSVTARGEQPEVRWEHREAHRAKMLQPQTMSVNHSDVESLCERVWQSMDHRTFSELFGDCRDSSQKLKKADFILKVTGNNRFQRNLKHMRPEDVEELWNAMDVNQSGAVSYADLAALLSPDETERRLYWRDKLLRGERRCCIGGMGEAHVAALAGQGSPLPLVSPHRRKAAQAERGGGAAGFGGGGGTGVSGLQSPGGGAMRAKGLPRSGVKRSLLVLQVWLSEVLNRRMRLPWSVSRVGWTASIRRSGEEWEQAPRGEGGAMEAVLVVLWGAVALMLAVVPACAAVAVVGYAGEACAAALRVKWVVGWGALVAVMALLAPPPGWAQQAVERTFPAGLCMRLLSHLSHGGRPRFNIGRVDLTRYSPWWLVIWPAAVVYVMLYW